MRRGEKAKWLKLDHNKCAEMEGIMERKGKNEEERDGREKNRKAWGRES